MSSQNYLVPIRDLIVKIDKEEKGGVFVHNNTDVGIGGVLSQGAIKLLKHALLEENFMTIDQSIQTATKELQLTPQDTKSFINFSGPFLKQNQAFKVTSNPPVVSPVKITVVRKKSMLDIPGRGTMPVENGKIFNRKIGENVVKINFSNSQLPPNNPIIKQPLLIGVPSAESSIDPSRVLKEMNPRFKAGPNLVNEGENAAECGACGVCGLCALCGALNAAAASTAALALTALLLV